MSGPHLTVTFENKQLRIMYGDQHVMVRRISITQGPRDARPNVDIEHLIFSEAHLALSEALSKAPGLTYVPIYMNSDGSITTKEKFAPKSTPPPADIVPSTLRPGQLQKAKKKP